MRTLLKSPELFTSFNNSSVINYHNWFIRYCPLARIRAFRISYRLQSYGVSNSKVFIFSGIRRVVYGACNDRFGGCGSVLSGWAKIFIYSFNGAWHLKLNLIVFILSFNCNCYTYITITLLFRHIIVSDFEQKALINMCELTWHFFIFELLSWSSHAFLLLLSIHECPRHPYNYN